ncbi:hypothetical protein QJS83_09285 [Bdellovibrio sp. 22V]|uniref:hypothetical protein n=1 Tax=Bdellovibrio sp. 22V TaxID=3044166 RepID=UPI002542A51A|nr:hypothetical protein [Bdellovibrio sp. 22V]WII70650.1 hypothetical protein QJS83_09285 [Bdellovibrio sp. 22V]
MALISVLCLILGFQNCSQSAFNPAGLEANEVSISLPPSVEGEEPSSSKVTYVEIPNMQDQSSGIAAKASELTPYRLVISTATGRIQLMDDANEILQEKCLSSSDLQELQTILSGSSVCAQPEVEADMCAARYTPPYASLYANEKRVNLGEARDSCGKGRKDLCGGLTEVFQAYISHVKSGWTSMNCE